MSVWWVSALGLGVMAAVAAGADLTAQSGARAVAIAYEHARIIPGDGQPPIEDATLLIQDSRIVAVGARQSIDVPPGSVRVDLTGKTVIPTLVNVHTHIGYEGYTSWGAKNYTPENVLDHLLREAYYGVGVTVSVGSSPTDAALQFMRDQQARKFLPASRFLFMPGMAPPHGGPDHILMEATTPLKVINEVTTAAEARAAIARMAAQKIGALKIWVDDRRGTYPKMTPEVYTAAIDEAHRRGMTVQAHATTLADQKAVIRAGADVLVHVVQGEPVDDELLALVKAKRPYWATVIGLGDPTEVCKADPFFDRALPASVVDAIRKTTERRPLTPSCGPPSPNAAMRETNLQSNFQRMVAAGARVVLGTDTGIHPGHTFGSGEHVELARWVQLGLSPADAIVAATSRPAAQLGLTDLGTLARGQRASFVVLDASPLDEIRNTRRISQVVLDGVTFDRRAVEARWQRAGASP